MACPLSGRPLRVKKRHLRFTLDVKKREHEKIALDVSYAAPTVCVRQKKNRYEETTIILILFFVMRDL